MFRAVGENHQHLHVTVHDDDTFSGFFIEHDEWVSFDSVIAHESFMTATHKSKIGNGTHLLLWESTSPNTKRAFPSGNTLPVTPPPAPCPSTIHAITITVGVSVGYYQLAGSINDTVDRVSSAFVGANVFLGTDLNLRLVIENTIIYTSTGGPQWNMLRSPECSFSNFNWQDSIKQCCGVTAGGILFHGCDGSLSSGAGVLCGANHNAVFKFLNVLQTRRLLGKAIGRGFGVGTNTNGIMGSLETSSDTRHDRFSKESQTDICNNFEDTQYSCIGPETI
mmetsp:Transcript_29328/g.32580  ORF Transcript_29328/g.32580 Transcript_29328/m.32580 type:complete len:279 (+) Transcript_29328:186-1022(+)